MRLPWCLQALFPVINSYNSTSQALEDLMNEYSFAMKRKLKLKVSAMGAPDG